MHACSPVNSAPFIVHDTYHQGQLANSTQSVHKCRSVIRKSVIEKVSDRGRCKTWTVDYGLHYGLDFGLDYGLCNEDYSGHDH